MLNKDEPGVVRSLEPLKLLANQPDPAGVKQAFCQGSTNIPVQCLRYVIGKRIDGTNWGELLRISSARDGRLTCPRRSDRNDRVIRSIMHRPFGGYNSDCLDLSVFRS